MQTEQIAFRMQLSAGQRAAYKARHDAIWPELIGLLRDVGISDYSIFLHEDSGALFAVLRRASGHTMDRLPDHDIMRRWWAHMADIMHTGADRAPVSEPLDLVFHMD